MVKISEDELEELRQGRDKWKAQLDRQNRYSKEKYDRISVVMPKGKKEVIEEHFRRRGFRKMTPYIMSLIDADMARNDEGNLA